MMGRAPSCVLILSFRTSGPTGGFMGINMVIQAQVLLESCLLTL